MLNKVMIAAALSVVMVGCASVPMGDPARNAELKTFKAKDNAASLYVYRNESMGAAVKMSVKVDGQPLGKTAAKTYLYKELTPGQHTIESSAENTSTLTLDAVAGKVYYVWQEVKMGVMSARTKLSLVDEQKGQSGVTESNLAVTQ
jgi:hypothetical protein